MKKRLSPSNPMINILNFKDEMRVILSQEGQSIWFSDGAIDILARVTIKSPFVELKGSRTLFKHQITERTFVPFMTYVPTTGVDERQIFNVSSTYVREHIGKFMEFFKENHSSEDIFPKDTTFLVSPYVKRYSGGEITSICAYFETDDNTWNFFEKCHPLELNAGSIYYSDDPVILPGRRESLWEFVLRKTIQRKKFS